MIGLDQRGGRDYRSVLLTNGLVRYRTMNVIGVRCDLGGVMRLASKDQPESGQQQNRRHARRTRKGRHIGRPSLFWDGWRVRLRYASWH